MALSKVIKDFKVPEATPQNLAVAAAVVVVGQPLYAGLKQTVIFFSSLTGRQQSRFVAGQPFHAAACRAHLEEPDRSMLQDRKV